MGGHELVRALRESHGCNEDCFLCREEEQEYKIQPYARWTEFVNSDQAMRIGLAVVEYKATFPKMSDDPLEQYLIEEAVLGNYFIKKQELEAEYTAKQSAADQAKAGLDDYMRNPQQE